MDDPFTVTPESVSHHCCFEATVVQSGTTVCECFTLADAEMVARALNMGREATTVPILPGPITSWKDCEVFSRVLHRKTWLFFLNAFLLQWLTLRLVRVLDLGRDRPGWRIWYGVVPGSGWQTRFRFYRWSNG